MNKKSLSPNLLLTLTIIAAISFSLLVFGMVYENTLPKIVEEINNASIGAILGAIVTVLLLSQQTRSEEIKEQNVKVFEKKSEKYEAFINEIWKIWEDRKIELEELIIVTKLFSRDILLYANKTTAQKVLNSLENITKQTLPESSKNNKEAIEIIQREVNNIVRELSNDINLGGQLDQDISDRLFHLEEKIGPAIEIKLQREAELKRIEDQRTEINNYQEKFISYLKKELEENEKNIDFSNISFEPTEWNVGLFKGQINNSNIYFEVWDFLKTDNNPNFIFNFFVPKYGNNYYANGFTEGQKNRGRITIKNSRGHIEKNFSFAFEKFDYFKEKTKNKTAEELAKEFSITLIDKIDNWKNNDGKSIFDIINECEPNLQNN